MSERDIAERYPSIFREWREGHITARFILASSLPPQDLISNVNLIPKVGNQWLIILDRNGLWDIPGGTLEPGENYLQTIRREMLEEAGAKLLTLKLMGVFHYFSEAQKPYRHHLPHPEFYRVVGVGDVKIIGLPADPDGHVIDIDLVTNKEAVRRFKHQGRGDLAALYSLAVELNF